MSFLLPDSAVVEAYRGLVGRVTELLASVTDTDGDRPVPHCPDWTVKDVVSHMVGVVEDILAGRMEGVTTETWTAAQVDRHRTDSVADLLAVWSSAMTEFEAILPHIPSPVNSQLVMDAVSHEHDLRHALNRPGARDSDAVRVALGWILDSAENKQMGLGHELRARGVDDFDLLRVLSGRRSLAQALEIGLEAETIASLLTGTPLTSPTSSIDE